MTIQLDNNTDIQVSKEHLSLTNDSHGISWDLKDNYIYVGGTEVSVNDTDGETRELLNLIREELLAVLK